MIPKSLRAFAYFLLAAIATLTLLPLFTLAWRQWGEGRHWALFGEAATLRAVTTTLGVAAGALGIAVLISVPCAWLLVRTDLPLRHWFRRILIFPYLIPPYLFAIAWITLAVPEIGILNRLIPFGLFNVYSFTGLVWVLGTAYLPIIFSSLCQVLDAMDPSLEEASRICGASPLSTFFRITLPCLFPLIGATSLLFLLEVMSAFGIPALVGNPARIYVLTTKIYTHAKMGGLSGIDQAFVVSLWLFCFTILFMLTSDWVRARFQYRTLTGKAPKQSLIPLHAFRIPLFLVVLLVVLVLMVLPLSAVVTSSFLRIAGNLEISNLTLDNYRFLFGMSEIGRALGNSAWLSLAAGGLCLVTGFFVAYFKDRTKIGIRNVLEKISTFPFAIPGTVVALALLVSFGTGWGWEPIALLGSPLLLLFAYVTKYLAISVQSLVPALSNIDPVLDEAGRIFGASPWGVLRRILFPLVRPTVITLFILTALPVFSELTMSVLLSGPGSETVGTVLFQLQDYANPLAACSLASLIVLVLGLASILQRQLTRPKVVI